MKFTEQDIYITVPPWCETKRVIKEFVCGKTDGDGEEVQNFLHGFRNFFSRFVFRRKFAGCNTRFNELHPPFSHPLRTTPPIPPTSSPRENRRPDEDGGRAFVLSGFKASTELWSLFTNDKIQKVEYCCCLEEKTTILLLILGYDASQRGNVHVYIRDGNIRATFINVVTKGGMFVWKHGVLKMLREDRSCIFELETVTPTNFMIYL